MRRVALVLAMLAGPALAAEFDPGAPEDAERTASRTRDAEVYALPVGPIGWQNRHVEELYGRTAWSAFRLEDENATTAQVIEGYRARLIGAGFSPLFACTGEDCGGFDFRFGVALLPPPAVLLDVRDFAQLSMRRADPLHYASVLVSRVQGAIYIQTVSIEPGGEAPVEVTRSPAAPAEGGDILPQDARAMLDRLVSDGHVQVTGLDFATGGAALSGGSGAVLDLLARMLTRDAELNVAIVGHSDNEGSLDANIALSTQRARSVMKALVERGVPAVQMEARGVGYLAPIASNTTPEGRAQNRRVELVLR